MHCEISVQQADFSLAAEYQALSQGSSAGAIVTFVGKVRDMSLGKSVDSLYLEHYSGMTEKALQEIVDEAKQRWQLQQVKIIHRVGQLNAGDQIVFVGVSSDHRKQAFAACEFLMDYLKIKAPFWKKEQHQQQASWVQAKESDQEAAQRWSDHRQ